MLFNDGTYSYIQIPILEEGLGALGGGGGGGGGGGVCMFTHTTYQSFCLWDRGDSEESALNMKCVFISTVQSLFT